MLALAIRIGLQCGIGGLYVGSRLSATAVLLSAFSVLTLPVAAARSLPQLVQVPVG